MRKLSCLWLAATALWGCSRDSEEVRAEQADASLPLEVTIGTIGATQNAFVPLRDGDPLEIVLGEQGLRFCQLRYAVEGTVEPRVTVLTRVEVTGNEPFESTRSIGILNAPNWGHVTEVHTVLFTSDELTSLVGRLARFSVVLTDITTDSSGSAGVFVELRDDNPCTDRGGPCVVPDGGAVDGS